MTALPKKKKYTPEQYLALEEKAEYKSEYVNGYIFKMAGGTEAHITISFNATKLFADRLRGKCRAYQSDMKVWVEEVGTYFYPDVTVVCGERRFHKGKRDIVENPILLVEVLSQSTKEYDKNDKFFTYQHIESFQEYVLISQNQPAVQQYIRQTDGGWKYKATIGLNSKVYFESVDATLSLQDIYDLVEFEEEIL
ncbi:MAG: Uma2 family endonuclease [Acidobacteria bacterium]|jgi:Uma2 family endonuclease|nr:Uma2 family endonuclease [Acidobacteriota bacterium]